MITPTESALYLGPAEVVLPAAHHAGLVEVRLLDGELVQARLALAVPYEPAAGDEVLVVCQRPPDAYIIGILRGRGVTRLRVPADLELEAPAGSIRLRAGRSVEVHGTQAVSIEGKTTSVRAQRINLIAATLVQRLDNAFTWTRNLLQFKSRRVRTIADEGWLVRASRAHLKTSGNTCINGETIHLG
jgi:hypothetical protein